MQYMDVLLSYTQTSDPQEIFQLLDILGQGAYGNVSKALHKETGQLYAIKILPATSVNQISVIKKQMTILRDCNDQHIVKYYGSYFKDNNLWIVMEYCMAGSVTDIVNITEKQLNQNQIASILESVLKGLKYLHDRKKIHRDIKAANILLDHSGTAKLADFGVSTEMMYTNARHNTHIGSPYWMSPEVIKYSEYNQKTDIWSLGVTAIQLAQGVVPYSHLKPFMAMWTMKDKPIQSFKQPEKWSPQFNDFIKKCLQINPQLRPDAQQLLSHQFIKKYSKGKKLLSQLVQNSMAQIQHFRAGQGMKNQQQSFDKKDLNQLLFNKADSNGSYSESKTVIVKKDDKKKNSESVDSVIEHSSNSKSFKKSQSFFSNNKNQYYHNLQQNSERIIDYEEDDGEYGSVIIKGQDDNGQGHSRNCSMASVSSVLIKHDQADGSVSHKKQSAQQSNYLKSYIQNMQSMNQKQAQFKQTIQQKITSIQQNFLKLVQSQYTKVKSQIQQFFMNNQNNPSSNNKQQTLQKPQFQSKLFESQSLLQYLYKSNKFTQQRQKLQEQYKQKYLGNIQPVQNNYMSMMLESGNQEGQYNNLMGVDGEDNILFLNDSRNMIGSGNSQNSDNNQQYRKKSQSSADSPTSLFNNRKKNIKKLVIQQALQDPNQEWGNNVEQRETQSVNTSSNNNNKSNQKGKKESSISKFIEKTPMIGQNVNKNKYKEIFVNSANFTSGINSINNKSLMMSTTNYGNSSSSSGVKGQRRIITTQPHEGYDYDNESISTLTKLNHRNLKQFYQDPVVMNNLKQLTQQSEQFIVGQHLNPFQLKKSSFSKQIKSVKSKQKQANKVIVMRQKQRATHIAHIAMAHNSHNRDKNNTINNNSHKKLKVIKVLQQKERSSPPQDNSQSVKSKVKKSKSKNKQTASTTIPFGSVGNMGALDFLPGKIMGKSKQKKNSQIPVKSGPFSKIKNRN